MIVPLLNTVACWPASAVTVSSLKRVPRIHCIPLPRIFPKLLMTESPLSILIPLMEPSAEFSNDESFSVATAGVFSADRMHPLLTSASSPA